LADVVTEPVGVTRAAVLEGVPHGFLGRSGGISRGVVAGLNVGLGADDSQFAVAENRQRAVAAVMPHAKLATVYQVHSPHCVIAENPWLDDERPHADALVTNQRGLLLGIVTADCAPVLFADMIAGVVGAAHAGWKGALAGVTDQTIAAMEELGAKRENITAAIGPCIAQSSYEVDTRFRDNFLSQEVKYAEFFAPGLSGRWQFNLEKFTASRLRQAGIAGVESLGLDTYSLSTQFFSYRRATHRGHETYGRQISLIGLPIALSAQANAT
jgi:YfiH family protein